MKKKKKKKYHSTTQPFFEKADWRKTRTRLQRMHNVSKRHIGGWNRDRELKEEWGEKKEEKGTGLSSRSSGRLQWACNRCWNLNTSPCTREKGKSAEWDSCEGETSVERRRGGKERAKRAKDGAEQHWGGWAWWARSSEISLVNVFSYQRAADISPRVESKDSMRDANLAITSFFFLVLLPIALSLEAESRSLRVE